MISAYAFDTKRAQEILNTAQKATALYGESYHIYPYPTYSVVEADIKEGGMEFSGLVYVNSSLEDIELEEVVAHETAHQWWYGLVGSSPISYAWLDEGLSEYSTAKYMKEYYGEVRYASIIDEALKSYSTLMSVESNIGGRGDIPMSQSTSLFRSTYEYVMVTYVKGMLFFENVDSITNGKLDIALKEYARSFLYEIATPEDLRFILESKCRLNLISVFDAWESGKVIFCF